MQQSNDSPIEHKAQVELPGGGPTNRLSSLDGLPATAQLPSYSRTSCKSGIVHLGVGAFFQSHLAVYTDTALSRSGGDWSIIGISLRSPDAAERLNPQNGLYTVLERERAQTKARIVGSLSKVICATQEQQSVMAALTSSATRIVSLTITEKAYGIDRATNRIDLDDPSISHDLKNPHDPISAIGYLVKALRLRRDAGIQPFTVLCCDNLSENGDFLRCGVIDFASRVDPKLSAWIAETTPFPSTMVDRITPKSDDNTYALAEELTDKSDLGAVEAEGFSQWVIEDNFPTGRPNWEEGGALFVDNVTPYENMKLRMLNGAHSMIAYAGYLAGYKYVRDVMGDTELNERVKAHLKAATQTLSPLAGIDFDDYADELVTRFCNPAIAHETYQIAMDGTQKLPQRLLDPAVDALNAGHDIAPFAFAVASWMRYCLGWMPNGSTFDLRDPREQEISEVLHDLLHDEADIIAALQALPGLFPQELQESDIWNEAVKAELSKRM